MLNPLSRIVCLLAAVSSAALMSACGGGSSSTNSNSSSATGAWAATVADTSGKTVLVATFNLNQSGSSLTASNLNFTSTSPCFGSGTTMAGQMMDQMNGQMGQGMMMTMKWTPTGSAETNELDYQGNMSMGMNSSSGTVTITGMTADCPSITGKANMTKMMQ